MTKAKRGADRPPTVRESLKTVLRKPPALAALPVVPAKPRPPSTRRTRRKTAK